MVSTFQSPVEDFTYAYRVGPVESPEELDPTVKEGNCRLALQLYFYRVHNLFFQKEEIYLPGGYKTLGTFVFEEEPIIFDALRAGDIIYAQNLRDREGNELQRNQEVYANKDEWLYHLHSAIYLGYQNGSHYVWHATGIEKGTVVWSLETFEHFYKSISVKRVL